MPYVLEGRLRGYVCDDCLEPLPDVLVRFYLPLGPGTTIVSAEDGEDERVPIVTEEEVEQKRPLLLGEARTDAEGRFRVTLDERSNYAGGALQADVRIDAFPPNIRDTRKRPPLQFTAAEFTPAWQGDGARWIYDIPRWTWCGVLGRLDAWVICGQVVDCESRRPVADVVVNAFDADWLQDDPLGSATTDANGRFRIHYTSSMFRKTPFSPWINWEKTEGPDLYFTVTKGGSTLLEETQADGRRRGRENVGHCHCVTLCVPDVVVGDPYLKPYFTHIGTLQFGSDVDPVTGLANKASPSGAGGAGFGFFGSLALVGLCPALNPGTSLPMWYRFRVEMPGGNVVEAGPTHVHPAQVGWRLIPWDQDGDGVTELRPQAVWVRGSGATPGLPPPPAVPPGTPWGPPPPHFVVPAANGWIAVDPDATGHAYVGTLLLLNTTAADLVPGGSSGGSGVAGQPPTTPRSGTVVRVLFDTSTDGGATFDTQVEIATLLVNNWPEVGELNALQFHSGPGRNRCSGLDDALDVEYTVDHELIADWRIGISSAAFSLPGAPANPSPIRQGNVPRGDHGTAHLDISAWPACSYTVALTTRRMLTTGFDNDDAKTADVFTFCIDREGAMHP